MRYFSSISIGPSTFDDVENPFFPVLYVLNRPTIILKDIVEHPELGLIEGSFLLLEGIVLIPRVVLNSHQRQVSQPVAVLVDGLVEMFGELVRDGLWPDVLDREEVVLVVDDLLHLEGDVLPLAF